MSKRKKTTESALTTHDAAAADEKINPAEAAGASEPPEAAAFCPNCGTAVSAECTFCPECGAGIPHVEEADTAEQQKASEPGGTHSDEENGEAYGTVSSAQLGTADYCTCCGKVITVNCTYCPACGVSLLHTADSKTSEYSAIADNIDNDTAEPALCGYCGSAIPFGALACSGCGASLYGGSGTKEARCCPCCGKTVASACVYCPVCGESLSSRSGGGRKAFAAGLPEWNLEPQFAAPNVRLPRAASS